MPILFLGLDLLFWVAVALTVAIFVDLATCWWATSLKISPLRRWRKRLCRYHKYTRIVLIVLAVVHIVLHVLFQIYGIII